jgi:hypothetical protein
MTKKIARLAVLGAGLQMAVVGSALAGQTINTKPAFRPDNGTLICSTFNVNLRPTMRMTAQIIDGTGTNVTDFVRSNWAADAGDTLASVNAESRAATCDARNPCYCKIIITDGLKRDVTYSLAGVAGPEQ